MEGELRFHTSVCNKHQEDFIAICLEQGIRDLSVMEHIRMRFIVAAMHRFTDAEFEKFVHSKCIGCAHEEWSGVVARRLAQEEKGFCDYAGSEC